MFSVLRGGLISDFFWTQLRCKDELSAEEWALRRDKWRAVLLSVPAAFKDASGSEPDQVWVQAWNRRQSLKQEHESMARTAMQTAIEIDQFKTMCEELPSCKGRLSPAQLAQEFSTLGLQSVQGGKRDEENEGRLTANLISQALAVKKGVLSSARAVELLLELETSYGTRSPFHSLSRLHIASTKPSTTQMRDWVLESIVDWLAHDLLQLGDISNSSLAGAKHQTGLVQLFELKKKVGVTGGEARLFPAGYLPREYIQPYFPNTAPPCQVHDYFFDILLPKSGMSEADRVLLKANTARHDTYRMHSGQADCSWMARLKKSAIEAFHLLEAGPALHAYWEDSSLFFVLFRKSYARISRTARSTTTD